VKWVTRKAIRGLRAISRGFPLVSSDDEETMERATFLHDALYAALRERLGEKPVR
jgi:hypothetical protein